MLDSDRYGRLVEIVRELAAQKSSYSWSKVSFKSEINTRSYTLILRREIIIY